MKGPWLAFVLLLGCSAGEAAPAVAPPFDCEVAKTLITHHMDPEDEQLWVAVSGYDVGPGLAGALAAGGYEVHERSAWKAQEGGVRVTVDQIERDEDGHVRARFIAEWSRDHVIICATELEHADGRWRIAEEACGIAP